ncbi:anhydro-N-acetylmuramic acid kinase [Maribellus sp. YY47]|uniref:anhydro-N-acetylmuramic acid kinase n=1 Tax=Maribellus sp. YY47 TaxID=2929486 RepID=UPI0020016AED|nr:anhydro-N-acetylmuramic acid kinase [Maribellus sp. YY47]MCK3683113.1 anhydro-N-acetylmuramic acid kinase [Maribellus sp. YY47]
MELYIGIMSGTSMDGVDAVVVDFGKEQINSVQMNSMDFPEDLKADLTGLINGYHTNIEKIGEIDHRLALCYAEAVQQLIRKAGIEKERIAAIGCHGQTMFHAPVSRYPFTMQLGDGNLLASKTGIPTVADFRRMDMAFGGQGAPLVPAFHQAFFHSEQEKRVILNLGGIANITILADDDEKVLGFDTGPANCLMDSWIQRVKGEKFDRNGDWAASGKVIPALLDEMLGDNYFSLPAPKSTGRELFHPEWIKKHLNTTKEFKNEDVQATLLELTAVSVAEAVQKYAPETEAMYVCGGGAFNTYLMKRLETHLSNVRVAGTDDIGMPPQQVEAIAFAWLAMRRVKNLPGNLPQVTGARKKVLLGTIYDPKTF